MSAYGTFGPSPVALSVRFGMSVAIAVVTCAAVNLGLREFRKDPGLVVKLKGVCRADSWFGRTQLETVA